MSDHEKVVAIDAVLNSPEPKQQRAEEEIDDLTQNLSTAHHGRDYYDLLEEQSLEATKPRRRDCAAGAIQSKLQSASPVGSNPVLPASGPAPSTRMRPSSFLSVEQRAAVFGPKGKFRVSLYKALLYIAVADAIRAGALNLIHSEKYRSLDEYLIPKEDWDARRDEYLQRADLDKFSDCQADSTSAGAGSLMPATRSQ